MMKPIQSIALVGLLVSAACGGGDPAGPGDAPPPPPPPPPTTAPPPGASIVFDIIDNAFVDPDGDQNSSAFIDLTLGQAVGWTHNGSNTHRIASTTVPSGGASFQSADLNRGDTFLFEPTVEGMHAFRCEIHPTLMFGARISVTQ